MLRLVEFPFDDKLKKEGLFEGGNARSFAGISRTRLYEKAYGICL